MPDRAECAGQNDPTPWSTSWHPRSATRHEANDGLFQAFFDKPEFKEQMLKWIGRSLYEGIRQGGDAASQ